MFGKLAIQYLTYLQGEDEAEFCKPKKVPSAPDCDTDEFMCTDGSCVKLFQLCDDRFDCADGADEGRFCTAIDQCKGFMCRDDSRCLRWNKVCDERMDCFDGSDEVNCELPPPNIETTCPAQEFMCSHSHQCVTISACCDGVRDCEDFSDELICNRKLDTPDNPCLVGEFWCVDGTRCLPTNALCDHVKHCPDGSDEILEICNKVMM